MGLSHDAPFPPPPPPPVADGNPPPPKRKEHWLTTLCALVIFLGALWLVAVMAIVGAAFVVSWAGGDVVQWLIGFPACAVLVGFVGGVTAELIFRRTRRGRTG